MATRRLGEILIEKKLISGQALEHALIEQKKSGELLGRILVRLGYLTERQLLEGLADHLQLPIVSIKQLSIDEQALKRIPVRFAWHYRCMPVRLKGRTLTLAMSDPLQVRPIDDLKVHYGLEADVVLSTDSEIQEAIQRYYGVGADTVGEILESAPTNGAEPAAGASEQVTDLERMAEDASIIRLVNQLLLEAYKARASDVHIEPYRDELRIRYRIDGILYDVPVHDELRRFHQAIISRVKIMAGMDIVEKRLPQDGRIKVNVGTDEVELRVSIMPSLYGENVVLRLLPINMLFHMEQLGMLPDDQKTLERLIAKPHGVIFVTGPTGSGKTTTLYACLSKLNTPDRKIITIENPIEYELKGVTQIPVAPKLGFTFMEGLRNMLRHDPDVMMVGEVRDHESAEITIRMALTGHLVFSTLHTNDASGSVTRLLDMGLEPYLVSSTILAFIGQRLVRTICPDCKVIDPEPLTVETKPNEQVPPTVYKGKGCDVCRKSGYRGRIGIYEIMVIDSQVRSLIMQKAPAETIKQKMLERGWKTMRQDGWQKVAAGMTTPEEVLRVTMED
ncbi:MAG: type II secretion system protein GspE [Candidatus Omnitrophica bacterium CG11_big_fil_rev_8_21_14_0_20_63_9]|nr:MAG: type II secretion system protein GspE [Candidatus Omnitrophica bacterium CG11_big_fil_rev_8_21_14_0_20_63_9]